jgi:hypothetical protein
MAVVAFVLTARGNIAGDLNEKPAQANLSGVVYETPKLPPRSRAGKSGQTREAPLPLVNESSRGMVRGVGWCQRIKMGKV